MSHFSLCPSFQASWEAESVHLDSVIVLLREKLKQTWSLKHTTFQGQSLTALVITLLTSTVILRGLLRYPERLRSHGHTRAVTAAQHSTASCASPSSSASSRGVRASQIPVLAGAITFGAALCLLQQLCIASLEGKREEGGKKDF